MISSTPPPEYNPPSPPVGHYHLRITLVPVHGKAVAGRGSVDRAPPEPVEGETPVVVEVFQDASY